MSRHQSLSSVNENHFLDPHGKPSRFHGFHDWFCKDSTLYNRSQKLLKQSNDFCNALGIDKTKVSVSFKNCAPMFGQLYDLIWLYDIESDQGLMTIVPKSGHTGKCEIDIEIDQVMNQPWADKLLKATNGKNECQFDSFSMLLKAIR
jgi:hypothetical protein